MILIGWYGGNLISLYTMNCIYNVLRGNHVKNNFKHDLKILSIILFISVIPNTLYIIKGYKCIYYSRKKFNFVNKKKSNWKNIRRSICIYIL